jgi:hypothetical protein
MGEGRKPDPGLMRNLGAFFGHIAKAIRDDVPAEPTRPAPEATEGDAPRIEVRRDIQEARHGDYRLRRTTIDEVLFDPAGPEKTSPDHPGQPSDTPRADEGAR